MKAQEFNNQEVGNALCGGVRVGVVSADWGVGVSPVFPEVEKMSGSRGKGIAVIQVGGLHGGRILLDTVFMSVEEEVDVTVAEEELGRGVVWNDAILVVEF